MADPTTGHWARVRDVFDAVADLEGAAQAAALDERCRTASGAPDPALRSDVEALLAVDGPSFLDAPAAEAAAVLVDEGDPAPPEPVPSVPFGPWRVVREIGRGGMGAVYLAERADGAYQQHAALKRLAFTGADRVRRFERERQILAGLDHPGIARLLDGGVAAAGPGGEAVPYLVMEYVEGVPITDYAEAHGLSVDDRVGLFLQVCDAVGHAHRHLVVHRDLKPSNVLVSDGDGGPRVVLLDFGVAKLLETDDDVITRTGLPLLTPEYAAPEQIAGGPITTATDVYALGVLLYELLTGRRPYEIARGTLTGIVEAVRDTTPALASAVAVETRRRALRGDLDAVTTRALEKDPAQRYGSAADLAGDLRRHLAGLPVRAHTPTLWYRARRFAARHRAAVGGALALTLVGLAGLAVVLWQGYQTRVALAESEAASTFLATLLEAADPLAPERRDTLRVVDLLAEGVERARSDLADQPRVRARLLQVLGTTYRSVERWDQSEPLLREALALQRQLDAPPGVLASVLADLALAVSERGDHVEAANRARDALRLAHADGDPAVVLDAERALGYVLLRSPNDAPPDSLLMVARDRAQRLYGDDALEVAALERNVGEAYINAGRLDDADRHLQRAIAIAERNVGRDHPLLVGYYQTLSFARLFGQRPAEAAAAADRAVEIAQATTPQSQRLGIALTSRAQALRRLGQLDAAEADLRDALPLYTRRPEDRATPLGTLASVLEDQGRLEEAVAVQGECYRLLQEGPARDRPVVVTAALKLARQLVAIRRFAAAEVILAEADALRDALPDVRPSSARLLRRQVAQGYVTLYDTWGRRTDADPYREAAGDGAPHSALSTP